MAFPLVPPWGGHLGIWGRIAVTFHVSPSSGQSSSGLHALWRRLESTSSSDLCVNTWIRPSYETVSVEMNTFLRCMDPFIALEMERCGAGEEQRADLALKNVLCPLIGLDNWISLPVITGESSPTSTLFAVSRRGFSFVPGGVEDISQRASWSMLAIIY